MRDNQIIQDLKEALEQRRKTPPEERFDDLVARGVIDKDGNVLRHLPVPPEDREGLKDSGGENG